MIPNETPVFGSGNVLSILVTRAFFVISIEGGSFCKTLVAISTFINLSLNRFKRLVYRCLRAYGRRWRLYIDGMWTMIPPFIT